MVACMPMDGLGFSGTVGSNALAKLPHMVARIREGWGEESLGNPRCLDG